MHFNAFAVVLACGLVCASVYAYPPNYSGESPAIRDNGDNDDEGDGGGYAIPQFHHGYTQLTHQHQGHNDKSSGTRTVPLKTTPTTTATTSINTALWAEAISAATTAGKPTLQPAFVYSAQVPAHIEPEANRVVNAVKLASSTVAAAVAHSPTSSSYQGGSYGYGSTYQGANLNDSVDQNGDMSKKHNVGSGSSSVAVILNGDQPEFTDALGQKVPKPQPSLQVASPIDLLNPDRYEFYTFDEHGELVKRLMTMEEVQSIVANGDGEGPTIIHHGPVEDRDPEKNVQDIVNSVQDVLNKEVESNKNTTSNILPVLDTPDVSSSWSMILPAIFGNTGSVDIFAQQKPQQIVMTPDTEILETSTKAHETTTTTKPKPSRRKPGQKRKTTTTTSTTEMTPQVIQEELDSHESVYTGMQQYQHLTANMQNYDDFSQLHMQPIYHKLPEQLQVESTTKRIFINNMEVVQKPTTDEIHLEENLAKKPSSVQHKPPHKVKTPNRGHTTTKRPHSTKQKTKRKPTTTSTLAPETSTMSDLITTTMQPLTTSPAPTTTTTTTTTTPAPTTTTTPAPTTTTTTTTTTTERITTTTNDPDPISTTATPVINVPSSTSSTAPKKKKKKPTRQPIHSSTSLKPTTTTENVTSATTSEPDPVITTTPIPATESPHLTSTSAPKKKKKKPTRQPIHTPTTSDINSSTKPHLTSENRKPSPKPHRPRPTQHHTATSTDLTAEGSAHQEVAHNKYQHVSLHRPRPKPQKPTTTTTPKTTTTSAPSTTVIFSPVPLGTVATPHEPTLIVEEFPGYQPQNIQTRTESTKLPSSTSTPATSGTSGYPIPSYGLTVEESAESNTYQYKKQPLPSLPIIKPADSKPYDQDIHTMQSFDQILQSLKQPELTDNIDLKSDETSESLIKPVMYDSAENMDQLEEMANKHMIPVASPTIDSTTAKIPSYTQYVSDTLFTAVTYPETTTDVSDEYTAAAGYTAPNMVMSTLPEFSTTSDRSEELTTNLPLEMNAMEIEKTTWTPLQNVTSPSKDNTETTNSAPHQKITEASFVIADTTDQVAEDSTVDSIEEHTEETSFESTHTTKLEETTVLPHIEQDSLYTQEPQTVMQDVTSKTPISQPQISYGEKDSLYVPETQNMVNGVTSETPISQPPLTYGEQDSLYVQEPQTMVHEITSETPINEPSVVYGEKDSTNILISQTILHDKTSETPVRHPPITYDETTTSSDEISEDTTLLGQYRLPVAAPPKEHSAMDDDNDTDNPTILVADLKPQLNLEVIKPSSQISMSDFQTQAATVASTLVDGTNTVSVDYNMMSSNETKDEIAFLMSDVIKQMSNNDQTLTKPDKTTYPSDIHYSSTQQSVPMPIRENYFENQYTNGGHGSIRDQANINNNRYSNIATLNASFLLPSHDEVMQPSLLDSYTKDEISTDEVVDEKPNYEILENDFATDVTSESSNDGYITNMQDESTTEINGERTETSTQIDYTTKLPDTMTSGYGLKPSNELMATEDNATTTAKSEEELPSSEESTTYLPHINNEDKDQSPDTVTEDGDDRTTENTSATSSEEEETTTPQIVIRNEDNDESTTFEVPLPSLSQIYAQQQKLEGIDDREALFEADSSVDTTTEISNLSEETTETQWQASSEENQSTEVEQPATHIVTTQNYVTEPSVAESSEYETYEPPTTDKERTEDVDETTTDLAQSSEEEISSMETATIKVESTEGQEEIKTMDYANGGNTVHSTKDEEMAITTTEQSYSLEDEYATNETNMEQMDEIVDGSTTLKDEESSKETDSTEMDEIGIQEITTQLPLSTEAISDKKDETQVTEKEDVATTTLNYEMSEETSEELSAMISEEDETDEMVDEDPYIKLGETTTAKAGESSTIKPILSSNLDIQSTGIETQTSYQINKLSAFTESTTSNTEYEESAKPLLDPVKKEESLYDNPQASTEDDGYMLPPPKPINAVVVNDIPTGSHPVTQADNDEQMFEGADEEDEDDQLGYQAPNLPTTSSTSSIITTVRTTTQKPIVSTTRRLSTLKPVSYFNKQPAYALYQEPVEPLYNKQHPNPQQQQPENVQNKVITYSSVAPQQRPMQRPPQLSNLMIGSTQATRPPVKLEPSPNNSKGLEASLANLDEDILSFARLCNELAFSYWKSITSEKISSARSLVISPFALTSMLSMVFLGARGSTSGEMNDILKLDDMVTFNPHVVFKNITDSVEKAMDSDIATTAFVREVFSDRANGKILQFFKEKTQQLYAGHVEEVNFHVVNDIIRRRTNLLVKRHTMGKVLEYLRTNSVWVNGPLATISANLFQTDCSHGSTQDRDGELFFQVHPTVRQRRLVPIPAILFKSGFTAGYDPNLEATVVAFGRIQDTVSMIYVMPGHQSSISPSDNLDRLEKELMETAISKNAWSNLLTSLMDRPGMEVQLPRFSHRSFVNATLGLQKMGLKGLFKSDYADLGGLTGSSNRDIYLSDMIQINTFSTCGEEKIADHHHVEMYPAPPLRKRNKDVDAHEDDDFDSSEAVIDFGSLVQDSALGRGFYDDLLDPKYLELPLPLRPRQARVPDAPRLRFDKPFLYFVRHNPTGMILFMGRFNPRLLP